MIIKGQRYGTDGVIGCGMTGIGLKCGDKGQMTWEERQMTDDG